MTPRQRAQLRREVLWPLACFAAPFCAGWLITFPWALRAALRRYPRSPA